MKEMKGELSGERRIGGNSQELHYYAELNDSDQNHGRGDLEFWLGFRTVGGGLFLYVRACFDCLILCFKWCLNKWIDLRLKGRSPDGLSFTVENIYIFFNTV